MDYKHLSWKEKRRRIYEKIKQISDHYGGDDIAWLTDYAKEVIKTYQDRLEVPLACFEELHGQLKWTRSVLHETKLEGS